MQKLATVSIKRKELQELKCHAESFYKLNRLMSKVLRYRQGGSCDYSSDLDKQYEDTIYEVGRLKGIEDGLESITRISKDL